MKRSTALVRRTPLLHRAGLTRRSRPIRPESDRKAALSRDAAAARDLVRDRDGCCVLAADLVSMRITDCLAVQEGPGGIHPGLPLSRLVWLCRECHRWVESRRTLAYG